MGNQQVHQNKFTAINCNPSALPQPSRGYGMHKMAFYTNQRPTNPSPTQMCEDDRPGKTATAVPIPIPSDHHYYHPPSPQEQPPPSNPVSKFIDLTGMGAVHYQMGKVICINLTGED